ncbi:hypothetical protein BD311DRAFT_769396 [Dichomitus squalens]|uniref:Zn(2)-C6 fungal-type domain-containing protein n=1 Tax=Dichomitus squalens TaxID=114155 RepID=A0A4Q9MAS6_9APHY|nr:hypothetical protein BD311DRAFT_769396 [Dichomitus squalens]
MSLLPNSSAQNAQLLRVREERGKSRQARSGQWPYLALMYANMISLRQCESCHTVHKRCVGPLPCERCRKAGRAEQCFEHKRQKHDWSSLVQSTSCSPTLPTSSFLSAGEAPSLDVVLDQEEFLSGPPGRTNHRRVVLPAGTHHLSPRLPQGGMVNPQGTRGATFH